MTRNWAKPRLSGLEGKEQWQVTDMKNKHLPIILPKMHCNKVAHTCHATVRTFIFLKPTYLSGIFQCLKNISSLWHDAWTTDPITTNNPSHYLHIHILCISRPSRLPGPAVYNHCGETHTLSTSLLLNWRQVLNKCGHFLLNRTTAASSNEQSLCKARRWVSGNPSYQQTGASRALRFR